MAVRLRERSPEGRMFGVGLNLDGGTAPGEIEEDPLLLDVSSLGQASGAHLGDAVCTVKLRRHWRQRYGF